MIVPIEIFPSNKVKCILNRFSMVKISLNLCDKRIIISSFYRTLIMKNCMNIRMYTHVQWWTGLIDFYRNCVCLLLCTGWYIILARNSKEKDPLKLVLLQRRKECIKVILESELRSIFAMEYYYDKSKRISFILSQRKTTIFFLIYVQI